MSFQALRWAFQQRSGHHIANHVLLVLADHASGMPICARPSIDAIVAVTQTSRRTVQRALHVLEAQSLIRCNLGETGRGKAITFELLIPDEWMRQNPARSAVGVHPCDDERVSGWHPSGAQRVSGRHPFRRKRVSDSHEKGASLTPQPIKNLYTPLTPQTTVSSGARQTGSLVWIDELTPQFEAWSRVWNRGKGFPMKAWAMSHPDDRSRRGRWAEAEWPPNASAQTNDEGSPADVRSAEGGG